MIAIYKRELRSYFHGIIGPLFIAAMLLMFGFFFALFNMVGASNNINGAMYNLGYWGLMFLVPILCMRSFSEERKTKTDQLLLTAPVSVWQIVFGKYLAMVTVFAIPTAIFCLFPLIISTMGTIPFLWNYTDILGFFLYGLMLIAICMFFSTITENQIICAVVSILVILFGNLSNNIYDNISNETISTLFESVYDFSGRLVNMMRGTLDVTSIIYFISVTALFLFLATQVIQKRRYTLSKNTFSFGTYSVATVVVMIVIVVVANFAALQIPDSFREIDVTSQNLFSLTDDTKSVISNVTDDITIYFLAAEDDSDGTTKDETVEKVLQQYAALSDNITLTYIDPLVNVQFEKNYTDDTLSYSSVIVVNNTNERYKVVDYNDMFETEVDYTYYTSTLTGYDIEGQVTNALQYVMLSSDSFMTAYVLSGHNESSLGSTFTEMYSQFNITTNSLSLLTSESVPDDCELLIINYPTSDLTEDETNRILDYIDNGGDILFILGYTEDELPNFEKVLSAYGINLEDGLVIETSKSNLLAGYPEYYILPEIGTSEIASSLSNSGNVLAIMCSPMTYEESDDVTIDTILSSTDSAYTATDPTVSIEQTEDSLTGTFYIGLMATKTIDDETSSQAIVYSTPYMFLDDVDAYVQGNNSKLFGNTLNAVSDIEVDYVTIPVKEVDQNLSINVSLCYLVLTIMIMAILVILIGGIATWVIRSKK